MEDLILDTETTGLGSDAEIIEIALIGAETGDIYLDTLVKPLSLIPADAMAIHGITNEDVANSPAWSDVYGQYCELIKDRVIHIYNADYDVRLVSQTCALYDLKDPVIDANCVMLEYAELYREEDNYRGGWKWQSLSNAMLQQDIDVSDIKAHRASADCEMTRRLLIKIQIETIK